MKSISSCLTTGGSQDRNFNNKFILVQDDKVRRSAMGERK
jgi:hypothetical protein